MIEEYIEVCTDKFKHAISIFCNESFLQMIFLQDSSPLLIIWLTIFLFQKVQSLHDKWSNSQNLAYIERKDFLKLFLQLVLEFYLSALFILQYSFMLSEVL